MQKTVWKLVKGKWVKSERFCVWLKKWPNHNFTFRGRGNTVAPRYPMYNVLSTGNKFVTQVQIIESYENLLTISMDWFWNSIDAQNGFIVFIWEHLYSLLVNTYFNPI